MARFSKVFRFFRIIYFGRRSADNVLDWLITLWLGVIFFVVTKQLGGFPDFGKPMINITWMVSILLLLHGIWFVSHPEPPKINGYGLLFFPMIIYMFISYIFITPAPWLAKRELLVMIQGAVFYWVVIHNIRSKWHVWALMGILAAVVMYSLTMGIIQVFVRPDWLPMGRVQADQYFGRASGTFGVPNHFAAMLLLAGPLLVLVGASRLLRLELRLLAYFMAPLTLVGIILSGSRGAWIASFIVILMLPFICLSKIKHKVIIFLVLVLATIVLSTSLYVTSSMVKVRVDDFIANKGEKTRPTMWKAGWEIFKEHPILGSGLGSYALKFEKYRPEKWNKNARYTHNDYLNTLSDSGIIGLILVVLPAFIIFIKGFLKWKSLPFLAIPKGEHKRKTPLSKFFLGGTLLALLGFAIHLFFDFHLKIPTLVFLVAIYLAIVVKFISNRNLSLPTFSKWKGVYVSLFIILSVTLAYFGLKHFYGTFYYVKGKENMDKMFGDYDIMRENPDFVKNTAEFLTLATYWDAENADAWADLGFTIFNKHWYDPKNRVKYAAAALANFENALSINNEYWEYWAYHGIASSLIEEFKEDARHSYEMAIKFGPNNANAWYYYAHYLSKNQDTKKESIDAVEKVLRLDPDHKSALNLMSKLKL